MNRRLVQVASLAAIVSFLGWGRAEAYIDPATGSYVLQILLAGLLGALFALKLFWHRLVGLISSLFRRSSRAEQDEV